MARKSLSNKSMDDTAEDFESIYKQNEPLVRRFMFWRTKDDMLAQDLTSHVFEKAWRTRQSYKGGSSKAWIFTIARTTLIDYWRKKKEVVSSETLIDQAKSDRLELSEEMDNLILKEQLIAALSKLPKDMKNVISLRFIHGNSTKATAKKLGLSEANTRVLQYRALKKLRIYLK